MTSERKREANRANARRSTGPRSPAGKRSASRNALKHGLAAKLRTNPAWTADVEKLARKFAPEIDDPLALEYARDVAEAQLQIQRARHAKAVFEWQWTRPFAGPYLRVSDVDNALAVMNLILLDERLYKYMDDLQDAIHLPVDEPERSLQFTRRALPEFLKFTRYETRAAKQRNQALERLHVRLSQLSEEQKRIQ